MRVWIVDAFTKIPFAGNPAAVMIVDHFPEDEVCQKIAAENDFSSLAVL